MEASPLHFCLPVTSSSLLQDAGFGLTSDQLERIFTTFDINKTNTVRYWEFVRTFGCEEDGTPIYGRPDPATEHHEAAAASTR